MNVITNLATRLPSGTAMGALFGNGVLGNAMTGLIRIPAFLTGIQGLARVAELAIRLLVNTVGCIGWKPTEENWVITKAKDWVGVDIRPHKDEKIEPLLKDALKLTILAIVASEFINILGGTPPRWYNDALAFLGPIRIYEGSYLQGVRAVLEGYGAI